MLFALLLLAPAFNAKGQERYMTTEGYIRFFSSAPLENIEAISNELRAAVDIRNGNLVFLVEIASFGFDKKLMQKHFNEQYMESDKYPEAAFRGKFRDLPLLPAEGAQNTEVLVEGELTIHGITRRFSEKAMLRREGNSLAGESVFLVRPADYDIKVPKMLRSNIAEEVEVTVKVVLHPVE